MSKVLIGITTYNRKRILEAMAKSLYESNLNIPYSIRVYDDNSTEYSRDDLYCLFPDAEKIMTRSINVGADLNTWGMYCDFLESDCDFLFNADSDLIFSKNWMEEGCNYISKTDGILSLFNTQLHKTREVRGNLLVKNTFGAAGTLFSKKNIEELVISYKAGFFSPDYIDWGFCRYFSEQGKTLYCTRKSYVQHIGLRGFNSGNKGFAYGSGFNVDTIHNGQTINDILENFEESKEVSKDIPGYWLFPFDKVKKGSSVVLYGSGAVGRDYKRQIDQTGFCKIEAIVDKKYDNNEVFSPEILKEKNFDVIVIATVNKLFLDEIKNTIRRYCPTLPEENIVTAKDNKIRI